MKAGLVPGTTCERSWVTTPEMGVKHFGEGVPAVLSSPMMILLMEQTCAALISPYLDEGEQTVGFHVDVKHVAPTKIGQTVVVKATLQEVKEQRFRLAVEAINDQGVKIGEGIHRRALINIKQFTGTQ